MGHDPLNELQMTADDLRAYEIRRLEKLRADLIQIANEGLPRKKSAGNRPSGKGGGGFVVRVYLSGHDRAEIAERIAAMSPKDRGVALREHLARTEIREDLADAREKVKAVYRAAA